MKRLERPLQEKETSCLNNVNFFVIILGSILYRMCIKSSTTSMPRNMKKYKTIFCDIDGSIFKYRKFETYETSEPEALPEACQKLEEWASAGHMIILTTARPEYLREHTERELKLRSVSYHRLIMEIERGPRFLINDMDPSKPGERATGVNLIRDKGFGYINWKEMEL